MQVKVKAKGRDIIYEVTTMVVRSLKPPPSPLLVTVETVYLKNYLLSSIYC